MSVRCPGSFFWGVSRVRSGLWLSVLVPLSALVRVPLRVVGRVRCAPLFVVLWLRGRVRLPLPCARGSVCCPVGRAPGGFCSGPPLRRWPVGRGSARAAACPVRVVSLPVRVAACRWRPPWSRVPVPSLALAGAALLVVAARCRWGCPCLARLLRSVALALCRPPRSLLRSLASWPPSWLPASGSPAPAARPVPSLWSAPWRPRLSGRPRRPRSPLCRPGPAWLPGLPLWSAPWPRLVVAPLWSAGSVCPAPPVWCPPGPGALGLPSRAPGLNARWAWGSVSRCLCSGAALALLLCPPGLGAPGCLCPLVRSLVRSAGCRLPLSPRFSSSFGMCGPLGRW